VAEGTEETESQASHAGIYRSRRTMDWTSTKIRRISTRGSGPRPTACTGSSTRSWRGGRQGLEHRPFAQSARSAASGAGRSAILRLDPPPGHAIHRRDRWRCTGPRRNLLAADRGRW